MKRFQDSLCKFNAELSEVFPCRSQVVTDDRDILLNVKNDRGDIGALVTNMLHILPLHLKMETRQAFRSLTGCQPSLLPRKGQRGVEIRPQLATTAAMLVWEVCLTHQ